MKKFFGFLSGVFVCCVCMQSVFAEGANCAAGYGYSEEDGCVICEAGWYSPGGTSECIKCGKGRYSSSRGSAGCLKCLPGTYAPEPGEDEENTVCRACPNGMYMPDEGAEVCLQCEEVAPYVSPDKTSCSTCPAGNCCYGYKAYICKKGTWAGEGLECPASVNQQVCTRAGGTCTITPVGGVRKGACTPCSNGRTTAGLGSITESDCSIQSASVFSGNGGQFSWPTDGSVAEREITSPYVNFSLQ